MIHVLFLIAVIVVTRLVDIHGFAIFSISKKATITRMSNKNEHDVVDSTSMTTFNHDRRKMRRPMVDRTALRWVIESIYNQLKDENWKLLDVADYDRVPSTDLPNRLLSALYLLYTGKL